MNWQPRKSAAPPAEHALPPDHHPQQQEHGQQQQPHQQRPPTMTLMKDDDWAGLVKIEQQHQHLKNQLKQPAPPPLQQIQAHQPQPRLPPAPLEDLGGGFSPNNRILEDFMYQRGTEASPVHTSAIQAGRFVNSSTDSCSSSSIASLTMSSSNSMPQLQSMSNSSPNSSFSNLALADSSSFGLGLSLPSQQLGSSPGAIVTAAPGMNTPPPTAPAQLFQMPAAPPSSWPSAWQGSGLNPSAQPSTNQMLATQFTYQPPVPPPGQQPRMDPAFPNMHQQQRMMDHAMAANPFTSGIYQIAPQRSVQRKDYHRMDGIPINKVRGDGRKCRKVYGMENKDKWCTQCRWKKACVRFVD
ncbi:cyclin-K-like isoform X1 [Sycon ciliatum]|uniref:cyclin-K-like isoform X1 n=2 Tax=Sycon ciliatum TaxID=27933 RepID=UPI0031F6D9DE